MNFDISIEIDSEAVEKGRIISALGKLLENYFKERDYGQDVENIFIGCICVKNRVGYEEWFKVRKPRYKQLSKIKLLDGSICELKGLFTYDIKLDFDLFVNSSDDENKKYLALEIIKSLSNLDALHERLKDFNKKKFKSDMETFLMEKYL